MARTAPTVRTIKPRTAGSGTRLSEEVSWHPVVYYPWQLVKRGRECVGWSAWILTVLGMLVFTRSTVASFLLGSVLYAAGLTLWVRSVERRTGGPPLGLSGTLSFARRRHAVSRAWRVGVEAAGITGVPGRPDPLLTKVTPGPHGGLSGEVVCYRSGIMVSDLHGAAARIAASVRCREIDVREDVKRPGVGLVDLHWRDELQNPYPLRGLPAAPGRWDVVYGKTITGEAMTLDPQLPTIVGGIMKSGKSNAIHAMIYSLRRSEIPVEVWISDPKGGSEFPDYADNCGIRTPLFSIAEYEVDQGKALERLVAKLRKRLEARQEIVAKSRLRSEWRPSVEEPLILFVVDEFLAASQLLNATGDSDFKKILSQGRQGWVNVIGCAQLGHASDLGSLRNLLPQRLCFATTNAATTDTLLDKGASSAGAQCHMLRLPRDAGLGFGYSWERPQPVRFRSPLVTNGDVAYLAQGQLPPETRGLPAFAPEQQRSWAGGLPDVSWRQAAAKASSAAKRLRSR